MMQKIRWSILIFGVIVLLAAMLQNSGPLTLKLFFFETAIPISVLLLTTSVISFLIGGLTIGRMLRRREPVQKIDSQSPTQPPA
jgi:uncharacterized integral membrane protein